MVLPSWFPEQSNPQKGVFVKRQAMALAIDHYVYVAYADKSILREEPLMEEREGNLIIFRKPLSSSGKFAFLRAQYDAYRQLNQEYGPFDRVLVEVLHPSAFIAVLLKLFKRQKFHISEHLDLFLREDLGLDRSSALGTFLRKWVHHKAEGTSVSSKAMLKSFKERGIPRLMLIPNVVETSSEEPKAWPEKQENLFIHISSLTDHQKNISGILTALKQLKELRLDWQFVFIGNGPEKEGHQKKAIELGLSDLVSFIGFVDETEKEEYIQKAIGHVMLSHYEGFSVSTAEAIALGCPVFVSDCGGPSDFVDEGCGYILEKRPVALALKMSYHIDHYRQFDRRTMYRNISNRFSSASILEYYKDFLNLN